MIRDGFHAVPPGKIATIVTHLEMRSKIPERVIPTPKGLEFRHIPQPDLAMYRDLIMRVGGNAWLWFSRLGMSDAELAEILHDPADALYVLQRNGRAEAILELDFRQQGQCELAFFGVTPPLIGTGAGRYLMNRAIRLAWEKPVERFHLHTCTLDSPGALAFYIRSGFKPTRQEVEITDDPRLTGVLPMDAGPHVPIFPG